MPLPAAPGRLRDATGDRGLRAGRNSLDLRKPIHKQTAAYGHFGRPELDLPWERTDRAEALAADAGIRMPEPVAAA